MSQDEEAGTQASVCAEAERQRLTYEELDRISGNMPTRPTKFESFPDLRDHNKGTFSDPQKRSCLRCEVYVMVDDDQRVCWLCGRADQLSRNLLHGLQSYFDGSTRQSFFARPPGPLFDDHETREAMGLVDA